MGKRQLMVGCAAFLCLVMAGIFLRLLTVQVLVRQFHMDNRLTKAILFDVSDMGMSKVKKPVKIDWQALYPFDEKESRTQLISRQKIQIFQAKIGDIEKKIKAYTTENLAGYVAGVEIANCYDRLIEWNLAAIDGTNSVVEIEDGQLTRFAKRQNTTDKSKEVIEFAHYCTNRGAFFVYVAAPSKIGRKDKQNGTVDYSNQNADEFLSALKNNQIPYIDLRDYFEETGVTQRSFFYRTDHHWKAETGLWVALILASYLSDACNLQSDMLLLQKNRYKEKVYKEWFLGSNGRKVTLGKTTPDDISLFFPEFKTDIHYVIPELSMDVTGDFEIMYDMESINEKDYYQKNPYGAYNYGDRGYISIENHLSPNNKRILIVKDSFANCVSPFLALECQQMDIIDLRHFSGSIRRFILVTHPDIVIILYNNLRLIDKTGSKTYGFR